MASGSPRMAVREERIGGGLGQADLVADLQPHQVGERQANGSLQFAGGVEDEAAVGGGDNRETAWRTPSGSVLPGLSVRHPVGDVLIGSARPVSRRRRCFFRGRDGLPSCSAGGRLHHGWYTSQYHAASARGFQY